MIMPKCSFCGKVIPPGTGKMYVKANGKVYWFCSSKCERNFFMRRHKKKVKWVKR